jgi:opine dehydrogenase
MTASLVEMVKDVWPYVSAAESVWETVLLNFNAIDHVAAMLANVGALESRAGGMRLWGDGASPSVVRAIEAVDAEILAVRGALGLANKLRYRDFLIAQGFAPDLGPDLYTVMRASRLMNGVVETGPDALNYRYITEDIPYALMLVASVADEVGVATPVIDGLVALGTAMTGRAFDAEARTLARLGLAGTGAAGLRQFAERGEFPRLSSDI